MKTKLMLALFFATNISFAGGSGGTMGTSSIREIREIIKTAPTIKEVIKTTK